MALKTDLLTEALLFRTENEILKPIYDLAFLYNSFGPATPVKERLDVLERIILGAGLWMTSKPPTHMPLNEARWNALSDLTTQCVREGLKGGAKFLRGPANMKAITGDPKMQSYWLEALSSGHQPGYVLSGLYEKWLRKGIDKGRTYSFWNYIGATKKKNGAPRSARIKGATSVAYLTRAQAEPYRVYFNAGRAWMAHDDSPFDTQTYSTAHSGQGWAIFVVSIEGELYAGSHITGEFHHSSFLSGGAVLAAGEMVADDGLIRFITSKSGHYGPAVENMQAMSIRLPDLPPDAIIMPRFASVCPAYRLQDFRDGGASTKVKRAEAQAFLPPFARSPKAIEMLNKIEA